MGISKRIKMPKGRVKPFVFQNCISITRNKAIIPLYGWDWYCRPCGGEALMLRPSRKDTFNEARDHAKTCTYSIKLRTEYYVNNL